MSNDNKWSQPDAPPPPLFINKKERDLVKQVNDEIIERVVGQQVLYYPIDIDASDFHPVYGEAVTKAFMPPVRVYALVEWQSYETEHQNYGMDRKVEITVHFHKRRLVEDQDLFARVGDFLQYGDILYEIVALAEPKQMFGQVDNRVEISAKCTRAREGTFNGLQ
jgi:hypothetical protein